MIMAVIRLFSVQYDVVEKYQNETFPQQRIDTKLTINSIIMVENHNPLREF